MLKRLGLFLGTAVLFLVLDQALKEYIRQTLVIGQSTGWPFPGFFEITLTKNYGIAFGMMEGYGRFMAPVAILIAGYAAWHCWKHPEEGRAVQLAMGLLASGALGNLIDRVLHGRVTDMFWFRAIDFPVFNIADACITVAAAMLILIWGRDALKPKPAATPPAA